MDEGESAAEAAVRELKEETGYVGVVREGDGEGVVMFNGTFFRLYLCLYIFDSLSPPPLSSLFHQIFFPLSPIPLTNLQPQTP